MTYTHIHAAIYDGTSFICAQCGLQLTSAEATQAPAEETGIALCEDCGAAFRIDSGHYEPNKHAHCADCCLL